MSTRFPGGPVVLVSRAIGFTFPLSYGYLAGYLRAKGEGVQVLFRPNPSQYGELVRTIMETRPVLVGFGSLYPELAEIRTLVGLLNQAGRQFPIVIGGQMVSPIPEFAVQITGADFGVIGEGEITLHRLVTALRSGADAGNIPGLAIRRGDSVELTGPGDYIEDLSQLPAIPYDLFPVEQWLCVGQWYTRHCPQPHWRFADRVVNVHGGRGCPFSCNFCYHHSQPRYRSMALAVGEARETAQRFRANMLYFSDETTLPSPARVREMLNELRQFRGRMEYSVSSRFDILDRIDDALLEEMKAAGCRIMGLGIESGSDRVLQVIGKKFSAETIRRGLERLRRVGILPTVSIMVGQHMETQEDVEQSITLVRDSVRDNPSIQYAFTVTTPFPGSQLYHMIFEKGLLRDHREFYDRYFASGTEFSAVVNLSAMDDGTLARMYEKIRAVYAEEKERSSPGSTKGIEQYMRRVAEGHEDFQRWSLPGWKRKLGKFAEPLLTIINCMESLLYESVQRVLDRIRLHRYETNAKRVRNVQR